MYFKGRSCDFASVSDENLPGPHFYHMKEIFKLYRGSVAVYGACPLLLAGSSYSGGSEVTANAVVLTRLPDGKVNDKELAQSLKGDRGGPLPPHRRDWTEVMADDLVDRAKFYYVDYIEKLKDPILKEYFRVKGPFEWIEEEEPELRLLRYVWHSAEAFVERLAYYGQHFDHALGREALKRTVDLAVRTRFFES